MTYAELVKKFLDMVAKIKSLNPAYKQPGDGSNGVCDCIGLVIGAIRRMGLKWTGIHGSNYAARYQTVNLKYIERESELSVGDLVYKAAEEDGTMRKPCNNGTTKHKWDLPKRYWHGNQYFNGDLKDYYHVGIVTSVNPLRITHMTSPKMKVDTSLGTWNYYGKARPIVNAATSGTVPVDDKTPKEPEHTPSIGSEAIVVSSNGGPVKMRQYPSKTCATWVKLKVGTKVEIVSPGETWSCISAAGHKQWYMMSEFLDVIGDGKGKY